MPDELDPVRRLLALKRHETPPPGYFRDFSSRVIARIEREEAPQPEPWWRRLGTLAGWRPAILGANALIVAGFGLIAVAGIFVQKSRSNPGTAAIMPPPTAPSNAGLFPSDPSASLFSGPRSFHERSFRNDGVVSYQIHFPAPESAPTNLALPASILAPPNNLPVMPASWNGLR